MKAFKLLKISLLSMMIFASNSYAEEFTLSPVVVTGNSVHESQKVREGVKSSYNSTSSVSTVGGSVLQNLNPVNVGDSLRYNAAGLINTPEGGTRFGGGTKLRTQGDWGASRSIDGLPSFKLQDSDGGGYGSGAFIPSIAIDNMSLLKGGRAIEYGNGTDGGVVQTNIKSGRNYDNHQAISVDASTAREKMLQAEIADHNKNWDYYAAGRGFHGEYNRKNGLEQQGIVSGLGKVGYNVSDKTRVELLGLHTTSKPYIYRNNIVEEITSMTSIGALTLDHSLSDKQAVQVGAQVVDSSAKWGARARYRDTDTSTAFVNHFFKTDLSRNVKYDGTLGAEYVYTVFKRDLQWNNQFNDYAFKTTNSIIINDKLTLTGGLRYTIFKNDITLNGVNQRDNLTNDSIMSYQAGAAYQLFEETKVRASYSTGYNRFFEKYGNFGNDALNANGSGDDIVESQTYEAGINQGIGNGYFDLAVYNTVQKNVPRRACLVVAANCPVASQTSENVQVSQSGIELEVFQQLTKKLSASASYMNIFDLDATLANGRKVNSNVFWAAQVVPSPEHQISLRIDYDLNEMFDLWAAAHHSTGYESVDANGGVVKRDGFTRVDLGTDIKVTKQLGLRFRMENLLAERDFGQTVQGVAVNNTNKLGRVFWVGVDYTF